MLFGKGAKGVVMEKDAEILMNRCSMMGVKPIMLELPYPPSRVRERNENYAGMLSMDYCGSVSEMTAIAQYINNENRMSCEACALAKMILGIAMSEMIHLQKLGELICLLGGDVDFVARQPGGKQNYWTPAYLTLPVQFNQMIYADIESEKAAINQYKMHMSRMDDEYVNAVLRRIIKDEEYHILMLQAAAEGMC